MIHIWFFVLEQAVVYIYITMKRRSKKKEKKTLGRVNNSQILRRWKGEKRTVSDFGSLFRRLKLPMQPTIDNWHRALASTVCMHWTLKVVYLIVTIAIGFICGFGDNVVVVCFFFVVFFLYHERRKYDIHDEKRVWTGEKREKVENKRG